VILGKRVGFATWLALSAPAVWVLVIAGAATAERAGHARSETRSAIAAPATAARGCTLSVGTTQICPVSFTVTSGKSAKYVVAMYEDHSSCDFAPPPSAAGNNGNYVVASLTINWGDGTPSTSGVAERGRGCPGTSVLDSTGVSEPITGVHDYKKAGSYTVSVSITYRRGSGNTYMNCATATPRDTVYNKQANCIALGAPARSVGTVGGAPKALTFSGALRGTVPSQRTSSCTAGSGGMNWPLDTTLAPSTAKNWSLSLVFPGNGTYTSFVFGGKSSFVLQSGLNGWVATSGSFTIRGKSGTEGAAQLGETVTANITLGAHEGSATGTVYVKGSWKCG